MKLYQLALFLPALSVLSLSAEEAAPYGSRSAQSITSPDGRISVGFYLNGEEAPRYTVLLDGETVLEESQLGLVLDNADYRSDLRFVQSSEPALVEDRYEILSAKRRENHYVANRRVFNLETREGDDIYIVFQVSNDGVAFRYGFQGDSDGYREIESEQSSFNFLPGARAWLQPMSVAKTGWHATHPSYEEFYQKDIPAGTASTLGAGWVYPGLFRTGDTWVLLSETYVSRGFCGTRLSHESKGGEYQVAFPDPRETIDDEPVHPRVDSSEAWQTPWRLIVIGSLETIAESTLGIDLAEPNVTDLRLDSIEPGQSSWSWPLLGDGNTIFPVQKRFIDYAADMGWEYCLVDCTWDQQIGYEKIEELADYAKKKGVGLLIWYSSSGDWNTVPYTPKSKLLTHESRMKEFKRLKKIGISGLKIDFFPGDGRAAIDYYHGIMEDAAEFGFLLNFHGATLPRGWHRTYPNLMTVEAIKGQEFITFEQRNADEQPVHSALMPFTRNVFDPMDFTPMVLDKINDRIIRRTTSAFELALSVLFTSGIQHFAEIPEGMAKAPEYVREFLRDLPEVWEDIEYLDGFPGEYVVLARKGEGRWYVCGINATDTAKDITLDLSELPLARNPRGTLITDGDDSLSFSQQSLELSANESIKLRIEPTGGFVLVLPAR